MLLFMLVSLHTIFLRQKYKGNAEKKAEKKAEIKEKYAKNQRNDEKSDEKFSV